MGSSVAKLLESTWAVPLLLTVTVLAYLGALNADFVWDDFPLIVDNPKVQSFEYWGGWFTEDLWAVEGVDTVSGFYRPLVLASFAVDEAVWGVNSLGFHLQSLGWHLLCVGLLFRLLQGFVDRSAAWAAAAVFALHPALSESVVWISARNDLMATAFLLGMLLGFSSERLSWQRALLGWVCFLGALLSKESSVLGVGLLVAVDWARWGQPRGWGRYAGLGVVFLLWGGLRNFAGVSAVDLDLGAGLSLLAENGDQVLGIYARLLFWPFDLSVGRSLEYLSEPAVLTMAGLVGLGALVAFSVARGKRLAWAGILFAALSIAPAAVAVAAKAQIGERYLYLPFVGLSLALASILHNQKSERAGLGVFLALVLGFLGIQNRVSDWSNEITLWTAAVESDPSPYTLGNLGHMHNRRAEELAARGSQEERVHRDKAMTGLEASFNHPLPYYDNCEALIRVPLRVQAFERGLRNLQTGMDAGCLNHPTQGPQFAGLRGALLAATGKWELALDALPQALQDPDGRGAVLRGVLLLLEGSRRSTLPPLVSFCAARPARADDAAVFDASVERLLTAGGLAVSGIFDDNGSAARFCNGSGGQ